MHSYSMHLWLDKSLAYCEPLSSCEVKQTMCSRVNIHECLLKCELDQENKQGHFASAVKKSFSESLMGIYQKPGTVLWLGDLLKQKGFL